MEMRNIMKRGKDSRETKKNRETPGRNGCNKRVSVNGKKD